MNKTARRNAILEGIRDAKQLHQEFNDKGINIISNGRVDIFNAIDAQDIELRFGELKNLLGLCVNEPKPGIIVTSSRALSIQRFTAAHELGHLCMGHHGSFDQEKDIKGYFELDAIENSAYEISANAFASEFLLPISLLKTNISSAGIKSRKNLNHIEVYRLSLTMGLSYSAVCWGLSQNGILSTETSQELAKISPKKIKEEILNDKKILPSFANVWTVSEEANPYILGAPGDLIVVKLLEHSSSGYLWKKIEDSDMELIQSKRYSSEKLIGSKTELKIILKVNGAGKSKANFVEIRSWENDKNLNSFNVEGTFRVQSKGLANEVIAKRLSVN